MDHICVIYVLCLSSFCVRSLLPWGHLLGKGWPIGPRLCCLIVFLSLSHVVSLVRCGTWLYRFLIFAAFLLFKPPHFLYFLATFGYSRQLRPFMNPKLFYFDHSQFDRDGNYWSVTVDCFHSRKTATLPWLLEQFVLVDRERFAFEQIINQSVAFIL